MLRRMLRGVDVNIMLRSLSGVGAGCSLGVSSSDGEIGAFLSIIDTSRASGTGVATWRGLRRVERVEGGLVNFFSDITSTDSEAGDAAEFLWGDELTRTASMKGDAHMDDLLYGSSPFEEETREGGIILQRGLIVIKIFSDSLLEIFLRSRIADTESQGYLLELQFLLRLEGARVYGCCHRVRVVANDDEWDNVVWDEEQYELNQHQQIASTRKHVTRSLHGPRGLSPRGPFCDAIR